MCVEISVKKFTIQTTTKTVLTFLVARASSVTADTSLTTFRPL